MTEIRVFRIEHNKIVEMESGASSLDLETRRLPTGFYTTFNTLKGKTRVMGLSAHLGRLYAPAKDAGIQVDVDLNELRNALAKLFTSVSWNEIKARIIVSRNDGAVYLAMQEFIPLDESVYRNGVHVVTADVTRHDAVIKDTGFIMESEAQRKLVKGDVFEVLLTKNGKIYEGMTSNFYAVINEEIVTANRGVLLGVTRKSVLEIARGHGMSVHYRSPRMDEQFKEAFLTSSSRGVVPIVSINNESVGEGRVGQITKRLSAQYGAYVFGNAAPICADS